MKKILSLVLMTTLAFLFVVVPKSHAASFPTDNWNAQGPGTVSVTQPNNTLYFSYNLQSTAAFQGQTWHFTNIAQSTEDLTFDWTYWCMHSWYQAYANAYAFSDGPNGTQTVSLYNGYGQVTTNGTTTLHLNKGYNYGFVVYGSNYDSTALLMGGLNIKNHDNTAPTTKLVANAQANDLGWYNKDVTITLNATDDESGVATTYYTVDNGTEQTGNSFDLNTDGVHTITYYSVDNAGNKEAPQTETIKIDKTAPEVTVSLDKTILPVNHKMYTVSATVNATDEASGVKTVVLDSITSNEDPLAKGSGQTSVDIQNADYGTFDTQFDLRGERSGKGDGRTYTVTYTVTDQAGNATTQTAMVYVPHNK